ncbi:MAG: PQQ-binding-like beta-propeller repeat protein [Halorientalis sp.]
MSERPLTALVLASLLVGSLLAVAGPVGVAAAGNVSTDVGTATAEGGDWPTLGRDVRHTGYAPNVTGPTGAATLWAFGGATFETSPAVWNGTVYAGAASGTLYAVNATTGAVEWSARGAYARPGLAPAVTDGVVYAANGSAVTALNATTGERIWHYPTDFPVTTSPVVVDGRVYLGTDRGVVHVLDARTGDQVWRRLLGDPLQGDRVRVRGSPAVANGRLYVGTTGGLFVLDASSGLEEWANRAITVTAAPTVVDGTVYVGTTGQSLLALDAASGTEQWQRNLDGSVTGSPAVADGTVYAGTVTGTLVAVDAATGARVWNASVDGSVESPVAVAGDALYVNDGFTLSAYDTNGTRLWQYDSVGDTSGPAVVNGTVYVGAEYDGLHAVATPPTPRVDVAPARPTVGESVTLDASASTPGDGRIVGYEWDLDRDPAVDATGETVTTTYEEAGGFQVSLTVTNSRGVAASTRTYVPVANPERAPLYDDWPTVGHDPGQTGTATATGIVGDVRQRWNHTLDRFVAGTPLVAEGTVFVGTENEGDGGGVVYALNASTGATTWTYSIGNATVTIVPGSVGSGTVYAGATNGTVHAIDAETGSATWTTRLDAPVEAGPLRVGDTVLVGTDSTRDTRYVRTIYGLDAGTGNVRWQYPVDVDAGLAAANGTVYAVDHDYDTGNSTLHAVDVATGTAVWNYTVGARLSAVAVRNGTVYATTDGGDALALPTRPDGPPSPLWRTTVNATARDGPIRPVVGRDTVYVSTSDATVSALNATTGAVRWEYVTSGVVRTPAVANGTLYLPVLREGGSTLQGIDTERGRRAWATPTGLLFGRPTVAGDRVFVTAISLAGDTAAPRVIAYEGTADTGPTAAATVSDASVTTGDSVTFDAANSTDDTTIERIVWRFDDGTAATGPTVTHAFDAAGTYAVTLTVTDAAGYRASDTVTVSVSAPDSGGSDVGNIDLGSGTGGSVSPGTVTTTADGTATERPTTAPRDPAGGDDVNTTTRAPATNTTTTAPRTDGPAGTTTTGADGTTAPPTAARTTAASGPGFGVPLAVLAVLGAAVLARRRG